MTDQNHTFPALTSDDLTWLPPGYTEQSDGIYFQSHEDGDPIFVCSLLRVIATFADSKSTGWGQLITVTDPADVTHEIPIFNELLDGPQQKVISQLAKLGLKVGSDPKAKKLLIELLKLSQPQKRITSVSQPGWVDDDFRTFSLGQTTLGERPVLPLYEGASQRRSAFVADETLERWRSELGEKCRGNPMMILAVSLAFSAPLLKIVGMDGGGLHFRGQSSSGKSTLLRLAASVWGSSGLVNQWRATSNGLEALAASYNDLLLPLDELSEITPRHLNETIYMLSHGKAKTRMSKEISLDEAATWRLALISSGELSVKEHLAAANLEIKEGQEVRLIDIEADARMYGVFDDIHGASDPGEFAASVQEAASRNFGAVGRSFLEKLLARSKSKDFREQLRRKLAEHQGILLSHLSPAPDTMAGRVAKRFALIGLAGELATQWGLTGWAKGEAKEAVIEAFREWHDRWIGDDAETAQGPMRKLKDFLNTHTGKLVDSETFAVDQTNPGFLHADKVCLDEGIWRSVFPGSAGQDAARRLAGCRVLIRGDGGHLQRRGPRCIPGRPRFYTIDPKRLDALLPK
jgi:putative DNA primase/helicase